MSEEIKIPPAGDKPPLRPGNVRLQSARAVTVPHLEEAVPSPANKTIHVRRPLPIVPEKPEDSTE